MSDWRDIGVGQVMSTPVKAVSVGSTLSDVMSLLTDERISGAVVTTSGGRPVGVVSLSDVVTHMAGLERDGRGLGGYYALGDAWDDVGHRLHAGQDEEAARTPVEAIMTPELVSVDVAARLPEVTRVMSERGVHRVLVLEEGVVVGLVSTTDVVRALHRTTQARAPRARAAKPVGKAATPKRKAPVRKAPAKRAGAKSRR
jgi:CBS domain-containing protein